MSKAASAKLQKTVATDGMQYRLEKTTFQQKYVLAKQDAVKSFMEAVTSASKAVAKAKHLNLVLAKSNILYAAPSLDITSAVLSKMK